MLSDTKARQARPRERPYKLADHGALYLLVSPTGAKSWRYDYRLHGRRETLTIGTYPEAKLAEARERHMEARKRVARGESPSKQKRIEKLAAVEVAAGTFKAVADKWYADTLPRQRIRVPSICSTRKDVDLLSPASHPTTKKGNNDESVQNMFVCCGGNRGLTNLHFYQCGPGGCAKC